MRPIASHVFRTAVNIATHSLARQRLYVIHACKVRGMACKAAETTRLSLVVTSPNATRLLAGYFASELRPADCYLLYGSVGSGKSFFCREFIRAACEDDCLPVPSPTFLLQNIYDFLEGPAIHHYDLYRLTEPHDLLRLDLPSSFTQAVSLVEWPERLQDQPPPQHLAVHLSVIQAGDEEQLRGRGFSEPQPCQEGDGVDHDAEGSGDLRWRRVVLASNTQRWQHRLDVLRRVLEQSGAEAGCWLEQGAG